VGQRINISLLDFTAPVDAPPGGEVTCRQYGHIVERSNKKNASLCAPSAVDGTKHQRESLQYTSDANSVDITLAYVKGEANQNFLIRVNGTPWIYFFNKS
jgi:hypothetical protein